MRTLLIDNYDSFTWNLFQLLSEVNGVEPTVVTNDQDWSKIQLDRFDNIVISPGPGKPGNEKDFGISRAALEQFRLPILGVCLGHQGLCEFYGASVVHAPEPYHGRSSLVHHDNSDMFKGIPLSFKAIRYHSLIVSDVPDELEVSAKTSDGLIMAVRHKTLPRWGVQFHPESICSEYGRQLLRNFAEMTKKRDLKPGNEASKSVAKKYQIVSKKISSAKNPEVFFRRYFENSKTAVWLDSSLVCDRGRFSFMADCSGPLSEVIQYDVTEKILTKVDKSGVSTTKISSIFDYLSEKLYERQSHIPNWLPFEFNLGYIGYLGYELKAECGSTNNYESDLPDASLLFADRLIAFDHQSGHCWLLCLLDTDPESIDIQTNECERWFDDVESTLADCFDFSIEKLKKKNTERKEISPVYRHSKTSYIDKINRCQDFIKDGESYEICLTNMASASFDFSDINTYLSLRDKSPVPFGAFLRFEDFSILSSSPERFVSVSAQGVVESRPIKGTRAVIGERVADFDQINDLKYNEKDRSENLMIVDLVRNDLNRTCIPGSVHASELFVVESFSHVHQLVSTINGVLKEEHNSINCVRAAFPGGSMTGAPKIRTMEIIDDLEEGARGVYSGSIGWFGLSGAIDLNIVIRTIVLNEGKATFGVGGAIISMSDSKDEYEETLIKARSSVSALSSVDSIV